MPHTLKASLITFEVENTENLPPRLLATALCEQGHAATVHPLRARANSSALLKQVLDEKPDMLIFYLRYPVYSMTELALSILARKWGYTGYIVCFGPLAVFQTEWVLGHASSVDGVIGVQAESALCALADCLARQGDLRSVPSLTTRHFSNPACPTDGAPCWRPMREAEPSRFHGVAMAKLVSTRGCQYRCAYCIHAALAKKKESELSRPTPNVASDTCLTIRRVQRRPMDDLVDEMKTLYDTKGVRYFFLNDENPVPTKEAEALEWASSFKSRLRKQGMNDVVLGLKTRADRLTPQTVSALVDLGLVRTLVGVETTTDENLKELGRSGDAQRAKDGMTMLSSAGVITLFNSLLIHPGATERSIADDLSFLSTVEHGLFKMVAVRPYAGTESREQFRQKGHLKGGEFFPQVSYGDPVVQRFFELSTLLDSRVLGANDPFFALLDTLLGATLNQRVGDRASLYPASHLALWNTIGELNRLRVHTFEQLLAAAQNDFDADLIIARASRAFGALHRHISELSQSLYVTRRWAGERHFRAMAAAFTIAAALQGTGCSHVDHPETDSDDTASTDTSSVVDSQTGSDDTGEDSETETDTEILWCKESGAGRQENEVWGRIWSDCGADQYKGYGAMFSVTLDENGRFVELNTTQGSETDAELNECYRELFKDEVFSCLKDEVLHIAFLGE